MKIRKNIVVSACYFVYTSVAATVLIFLVGVGSQGVTGNISLFLILALTLLSPVPMLFVGLAFLRRWPHASALAISLALAQSLAAAMQSEIAGGIWVSELPAWRAALFYLCDEQTFYLPGSLVMPIFSLVPMRRGSDVPKA